ncbi:hypothetical protein KIL84_017675 [Mauremys mutica]|uniref:Uncharacterized protein n=1 Tax=Mauremys mutica TaxID=74926 RepID=A0A9D4AYU9_9SAUR|nr:hypothetical protein KIL84_017675 [Mauremys mutica]
MRPQNTSVYILQTKPVGSPVHTSMLKADILVNTSVPIYAAISLKRGLSAISNYTSVSKWLMKTSHTGDDRNMFLFFQSTFGSAVCAVCTSIPPLARWVFHMLTGEKLFFFFFQNRTLSNQGSWQRDCRGDVAAGTTFNQFLKLARFQQ